MFHGWAPSPPPPPGWGVNDRGPEAAAATVVAAASGTDAPPPEGVELDLDRPFLYGIADRETGVPLFLGTFERP